MPNASISIDGTEVISKTNGATYLSTDIVSVNDIIVPTGFSAPPGFSPSNPGISAKQLMDTYGYGSSNKPGNGWYWIKPADNLPAIYTYCDFENEGGGWTAFRMYSHYNYNGGASHIVRNDGYTHYSVLHKFADEFDAPLDWKKGLKSGSNTEYFFYISNNGTTFDTNASNNFVVVKPTQVSEDFLHKNNADSTQTGIPCYGKCTGYSIGQPPYDYDYHCYWWSYTSDTETHTDMGHLPNAVASQDAFGHFLTLNSAIWSRGKYLIKMAR